MEKRTMKLIIAGGRDYEFTGEDMNRLTFIHRKTPIAEVVSGACPTGADAYGEYWAELHGVPVRRFPADWAKHGRAAGPIRNAEMAAYADALAVFPGGRGTDSMVREATARGLKIFDFRNPLPA